MNHYRITPKTKTVWHKNKISGHEWPTQETIPGFEVTGGIFLRSSHKTLIAAEKDIMIRKSIDSKPDPAICHANIK